MSRIRTPHVIEETGKRVSTYERLRLEVEALAKEADLAGWNAFVESIQVPRDLYPALMTKRPELLSLMKARGPMSEEDVNKLLKVIAVLIRTNIALQKHAEQVAHLVDNWTGNFKALESVGQQIRMFANFRHADVDREGEED